LEISSCLMPGPVSSTVTCAMLSSYLAFTLILPCSVNLMALLIKFVNT